jgi:hypothetical protein
LETACLQAVVETGGIRLCRASPRPDQVTVDRVGRILNGVVIIGERRLSLAHFGMGMTAVEISGNRLRVFADDRVKIENRLLEPTGGRIEKAAIKMRGRGFRFQGNSRGIVGDRAGKISGRFFAQSAIDIV